MATVTIQTVRPLSAKGTKLPVGGREYNFVPNRRGDFVAEVVEEDVPTILSISQGYQVYRYQQESMGRGDEVPVVTQVREAAERATPAPPVPRGQHREPGFGPKKRGPEPTFE